MLQMTSVPSGLDATYNAWSESYDSSSNIMLDAEAPAVDSILSTLSYASILDAATGTGRYAVRFAREGKKVSAFDANERMLQVARKKAAGLSIDFTSACLPDVPFEEAQFDLAICAMGLAHVIELEASVAGLARTLQPGGSLIVSDLHPSLQAEAGPNYKELIAGEMRSFPQFRQEIGEYLVAFDRAGLNLVLKLEVPVHLPSRGSVPGVCVFYCERV